MKIDIEKYSDDYYHFRNLAGGIAFSLFLDKINHTARIISTGYTPELKLNTKNFLGFTTKQFKTMELAKEFLKTHCSLEIK